MAGEYMRKEIGEGPEAVKKTLEECREEVERVKAKLAGLGSRKGFIIGSGTSFHASLFLQYLINRLTKYHFTAVPASEFAAWRPTAFRDYAIIGFSQSGESSDILQAVEAAKKEGVCSVGITNTPGSTLTKISDVCIVTRAGEEKAVTATKTYDTQLAASCMLAVALSGDGNGLLDELKRIPSVLERVIGEEGEIRKIALKYRMAEHVFVLGHGANLANAYEAALKLKEAAMIHAEGFAAREFLHGPIQLVGWNTLVLALLPDKESLRESEKALEKLKEYSATVLAIAGEDVDVDGYAEDVIRIPSVKDPLTVFPVVKAVQLLALHTALARNLNPDKPARLTKVVKYQ